MIQAVLTPEKLAPLGLADAERDSLLWEFLTEVRRVAPCLFEHGMVPADQVEWAAVTVLGAIRRQVDMRRQVVTESAGRQSATYRPAAQPAYDSAKFTGAELDGLRGLCVAVADPAATGVPRFGFPAAPDYRSLFGKPGRNLP